MPLSVKLPWKCTATEAMSFESRRGEGTEPDGPISREDHATIDDGGPCSVIGNVGHLLRELGSKARELSSISA